MRWSSLSGRCGKDADNKGAHSFVTAKQVQKYGFVGFSSRLPIVLTCQPPRKAPSGKSFRSPSYSEQVGRIFRNIHDKFFVVFTANGYGMSRNQTRLSVWKIKTACALLTERGSRWNTPHSQLVVYRQASAKEDYKGRIEMGVMNHHMHSR